MKKKINETPLHTDTKNQSVNDRQENLLNSGEQSNDLKTHWHTPTNARELAKQANEMATMVLNNKVDMQVAQKYSALVRGISQLMSLEVAKARLEKTKIDLDL